jgi:hypothetical protein
VKMYHHDENATQVSWGGKVFDRGHDGSFDIDTEAAGDVTSHGLSTKIPEWLETRPDPKKKPDPKPELYKKA